MNVRSYLHSLLSVQDTEFGKVHTKSFLSGEKDQYYSFLSVTFGMVPTTHDVLLFLSPTLPDVSLYNYMISFPGIPFRT